MSDLISRQAAIDEVEAKKANEFGKYFEYNVAFNDGLRSAVYAIEDLPSAQPEPQWIPCSERLPKFGKMVLITNDKGNVSYGRFRGVEFWKDDGDCNWTWKKNTVEHVLAWMPLPEPYSGADMRGERR